MYITTNKYDTVLYTGMTSNLVLRTAQHKSKSIPGFTSRYRVTKLVYFEEYQYVWDAIAREKQLKSGSRAKKIKLIEDQNPSWSDLFDEFKYRE